jgi:superfamily II DNA/RNA helicase
MKSKRTISGFRTRGKIIIESSFEDDSNGILMFVSPNLLALFAFVTSPKTGLFSATLSAFIIEFYKKLSRDPG